jgi:hypothetical protein
MESGSNSIWDIDFDGGIGNDNCYKNKKVKT